MNLKIMSLGLAACATVASAGTFFSEIEDNNTLALANDIGTFSAPGGSVAIDGTLSEGDVDWFAFSLTDSASLSFFAAFSAGDGDGIMQLVTGAGDVIAFDDDSGVGLMPAIQVADLASVSLDSVMSIRLQLIQTNSPMVRITPKTSDTSSALASRLSPLRARSRCSVWVVRS